MTALVAIGIEKSMAKYLLIEVDDTEGVGKFCVVLYLWFIDRKQIKRVYSHHLDILNKLLIYVF